MKQQYVVKSFDSQAYYCGGYEWSKETYHVHLFETLEDAEDFIKRESGRFQIEIVYSV